MDLRLAAYREGGIPRYARSLLAALAQVAPAEDFVALQHRRGRTPLVTAPNVRTSALWTPPHHRWEQAALPLELLPRRLDVLHSPDFIPPFARRGPTVITVHDLAFLRFPEILTPESARYYGQVGRAVEHAAGVIAVSAATKADMVELLGARPERISVIHHGVDAAFRPAMERDYTATLSGLPPTFLLWVGTLEPRKGLPLLLEAFSLALPRLREELATLVLVGPEGWLTDDLRQRAERLGVAHRVRFTGQVSRAEQVRLYQAAWAFVFPSLYEGFGLPPLEAMACGTPVIAANVSAMPEVLGDAAVLTPAQDVDALADAIVALADDPERRASLRAAGVQHAARFRWEDAARQTLAVYRKAVRQ